MNTQRICCCVILRCNPTKQIAQVQFLDLGTTTDTLRFKLEKFEFNTPVNVPGGVFCAFQINSEHPISSQCVHHHQMP